MIAGKNDLMLHWLIVGLMAGNILVYLVIGHVYGHELIDPLPESQRIVLRSAFYILTIIGFPITNLIRHIQLRLNQTMPGGQPPKTRYLVTILVSMIIMDSIGAFGLIIFMLGDELNSLYIFAGLAALGLFLYRPKQEEYESIVESLSQRQ